MLVDPTGTQLISHLGWVDHGALWVYRAFERQARSIHLSDAEYLILRPGANGYFSVVHNYGLDRVEVTVHHHDDPGLVLGRIELHRRFVEPLLSGATPISSITGEAAIWAQVPRAYIGCVSGQVGLILVDAGSMTVQLQRFNSDTRAVYDLGDQSIVGVSEVPGSNLLLISISRDSHPLIYDPVSQSVVQKVGLADRRGNSDVYFRSTAPELWAIDYDTLVRVDTATWQATGSLRLQFTDAPHFSLFVGSFAFDRGERMCAVARPHSGDVVGIDTERFEVKHIARLGGEPLSIGILADGRVITRDWHSGEFREGKLEPLTRGR